jgi:hypothetical protein
MSRGDAETGKHDGHDDTMRTMTFGSLTEFIVVFVTIVVIVAIVRDRGPVQHPAAVVRE